MENSIHTYGSSLSMKLAMALVVLVGSGCGFMSDKVSEINGHHHGHTISNVGGGGLAAGGQLSTSTSMTLRGRLGGTVQGTVATGSTVQVRTNSIRLVQ